MNGPYAHDGMNESYDRHTETVAAVRKALGPDIALMVDVQYLWSDAETCLSVIKDLGRIRSLFPRNADLDGQPRRPCQGRGRGADEDRIRRMAGDAA